MAADPVPELWRSPPSAAPSPVTTADDSAPGSSPEVAGEVPAVSPLNGPAPLRSADFERLFLEFAPYVLRVLPRMGVATADVEDVAQDVFLTVHRALPGFEGRSSVRTWVYGICIRVAGNYRQRAYRRHEQLTAAADEELNQVDARTPARDLEARRTLAALDAALERVSDVQRAVFVLHEIEQLSITEIAAVLECPKFTVYARLYAARRTVHAELKKSGETRDE